MAFIWLKVNQIFDLEAPAEQEEHIINYNIVCDHITNILVVKKKKILTFGFSSGVK